MQKYLVTQSRKSETLGTIIDQMEARLVNNFPNAVLVSNIKTKLKDKI